MFSDTATVLMLSWRQLLREVRRSRLTVRRLRQLLNLILYDGYDASEAELTAVQPIHASHSETSLDDTAAAAPRISASRVRLTPVERLLRFIQKAEAQGRAIRRRQSLASSQLRRALLSREFDTYTNLKRLLVMVLVQARSIRPLSRSERTSLYAQLINVASKRQRMKLRLLNAPVAPRKAARRRRAQQRQLEQLHSMLSSLPSPDLEASAYEAWSLYRTAKLSVRQNPANAEKLVAAILERPPHRVPNGLYFHGLAALWSFSRGTLKHTPIAEIRVGLASACATLSPRRSLDRIAILCYLAADALQSGATAVARSLRRAAHMIAEREADYLARQSDWIQKHVAYLIGTADDNDSDLAPQGVIDYTKYRLALNQRLATGEPFNGRRDYETLLTLESADIGFLLFRDALALWTVRESELQVTDRQLELSWRNVLLAVDRARTDTTICRLAQMVTLQAYTLARRSGSIDRSLDWYQRLTAVEVLTANWQTLVDSLTAEGHRNFLLRQLGHSRDAERLLEDGQYWSEALRIGITAERDRYEWDDVGSVLTDNGGTAFARSLCFEIDRVADRWRGSAILDEAEGLSVSDWASRYTAAPDAFVENNTADDTLSRWFADFEYVDKGIAALSRASGADRTYLLTALAWTALGTSKLLSIVERKIAKSGQTLASYPLARSTWQWVLDGISWADEAIRSSEHSGSMSLLYRALEARARLGKHAELLRGRSRTTLHPDVDHGVRPEHFRSQQLRIDTERIESTAFPERRLRSLLKAERSFAERHSEDWAREFRRPVVFNKTLLPSLALLQHLKTFNYARLLNGTDLDYQDDPTQVTDFVEAGRHTSNVWDRTESYSATSLGSKERELLRRHLFATRAAILEFAVHPGEGAHWRHDRWGTTCFVVRGGPRDLTVQPIFLRAPESLMASVVDGDAVDVDDDGAFGGLARDIFLWANTNEHGGGVPTILRELSDRMFPPAMMRALKDVQRIYLCPHRQLFQLPLHAFFVGDRPLFELMEVSYATKISHIVSLLRQPSHDEKRDTFWLVDDGDEFSSLRQLPTAFKSTNQWRRRGSSVEDLLRRGAAMRQAVICCHGQLDEARPGRARLQLWSGGRLITDDIHRAAVGRDGQQIDFHGSEWVLAACEAGMARLSTMHMAPGIGLSFVSCGAQRVSSSLYRVLPRTAGRFVRHLLTAQFNRRISPFTAACRQLYRIGNRSRSAWAEAAAFTSFGLFGT